MNKEGALCCWAVAHANSVPCNTNEPDPAQTSGCNGCKNNPDGTSESCELESPPTNQQCTLPTNVDGVVCWTSGASCEGGEYTLWSDPDCTGFPFAGGPGCSLTWTAGGWDDKGDQPICPQP